MLFVLRIESKNEISMKIHLCCVGTMSLIADSKSLFSTEILSTSINSFSFELYIYAELFYWSCI